MTPPDQIAEIFATYEKHGWHLRRIILADPDESPIPAVNTEIPVLKSDVDAAWFSRPPQLGEIAWEIRYLGESPFALLEHFDESDPNFETKLALVEARLKKSVALRATSGEND